MPMGIYIHYSIKTFEGAKNSQFILLLWYKNALLGYHDRSPQVSAALTHRWAHCLCASTPPKVCYWGPDTVVVYMHSVTGGLEFLKQSLRVEVRLSCNDSEDGETSQGTGAGKQAIPQSVWDGRGKQVGGSSELRAWTRLSFFLFLWSLLSPLL